MGINAYRTAGGIDPLSKDGSYSDDLELTDSAVVYLRADDGLLYADVTAGPVTDHEFSANGSSWASSVNLGSVGSTSVALHIRKSGVFMAPIQQVVDVVYSSAVDEPDPPAAFTPTVGSVTYNSAVVSFSTTDPEGDPLTYKVAVTESATPPVDWSGYSNQTSPYTASALTAETTYYAHVRAFDGVLSTVGTSASFTTAAAPSFSLPDEFNGTAGSPPDAAFWTTLTAGSGTCTQNGSGSLVCNSPAITDAAAAVRTEPITVGATKTYKCKGRINTATTGSGTVARLLEVQHGNSIAVGLAFRLGAWYTAGSGLVIVRRNGATAQYWTGSTWTNTGTSLSFSTNTDYVFILNTRTNAGTPEFQFVVKSADETSTVYDTGWTAWSTATPTSLLTYSYLCIGDPATIGAGRSDFAWYDEPTS